MEVFGHLPMSLAQQEERKLKLLALYFVIDREVARMREENDCESTPKIIQKVAVFKLEHEGRLPTNSVKSDERQRALAREFGRVRQQCQQGSAPRIVADAVRGLQSPQVSSNIQRAAEPRTRHRALHDSVGARIPGPGTLDLGPGGGHAARRSQRHHGWISRPPIYTISEENLR